jgi:hypothetical protein
MEPIAGDQKKRVVSSQKIRGVGLENSLVCQCYFFDSDIGGFHYGPGHPYAALREFHDPYRDLISVAG